MLTAGDIIDQARFYDAGLTRENHPDQLCRAYLSTYHRQLVGKVIRRDRKAISAEISVSLPLATFEDGVELQDGAGDPIQYHRLQVCDAITNGGDTEELNIIPAGRRFGRVRFPAAYILGTTQLYLVGYEKDWNPYASLTIRYAPIPGDFTTNATEVVVPDDAMDVLSWRLAAFLGKRRPETLTGDPAVLEDEARTAEAAFLDTVSTRKPSKSRVKETF